MTADARRCQRTVFPPSHPDAHPNTKISTAPQHPAIPAIRAPRTRPDRLSAGQGCSRLVTGVPATTGPRDAGTDCRDTPGPRARSTVAGAAISGSHADHRQPKRKSRHGKHGQTYVMPCRNAGDHPVRSGLSRERPSAIRTGQARLPNGVPCQRAWSWCPQPCAEGVAGGEWIHGDDCR